MRGFGEDWSFGKRPWIKVSFPFQACRALRSELGKCQWSSPKFSGVGLAVWLPAQARDRAVHSALRFPAIRNCELHLFLPGSFCRGLTVALCGLVWPAWPGGSPPSTLPTSQASLSWHCLRQVTGQCPMFCKRSRRYVLCYSVYVQSEASASMPSSGSWRRRTRSGVVHMYTMAPAY